MAISVGTTVAFFNSRIPEDEHEFDKNTGAIATGTRIGRRGDCVITKLSPEQRSEVALEGRGRAVGEEGRSEEITMNGRTANGLLIQGVSRDVEAAITAAFAAFLGRQNLNSWSLEVRAIGGAAKCVRNEH